MKRGLAILKIHSHPQGLRRFSTLDDTSDKDLFASVHGWTDGDYPHASAVMLPDGRIFGRAAWPSGEFTELAMVSVIGEELQFWHHDDLDDYLPEFTRRHAQAFGSETTNLLARLSAAVVGCSGTGSPVTEQLVRLGMGKVVLVDPDYVEEKNLNRILNSEKDDAVHRRHKVEVAARAIARAGLGTRVVTIPKNLAGSAAVKAVAECDVVFGCMDGAEGRHLLNRLSTFYLLPYFDVGVRLDADGQGGIDQICGGVHYLRPDSSSLLSRGVMTLDQIGAESLRRTDPAAYRDQVKAKYSMGVQEDRPAVISVNMFYASLAVLEFLARLHSYRDDGNVPFARFGASLTQCRFYSEPEGAPCPVLSRHAGRGDVTPLLDMPALTEQGDLE
jgi:hypothetical protein